MVGSRRNKENQQNHYAQRKSGLKIGFQEKIRIKGMKQRENKRPDLKSEGTNIHAKIRGYTVVV